MPELSLNRLILEDKARARINEYYYRSRADRLLWWESAAKVTVAIGSGGALTASLTNLINDPHVFQVLSAITALAAIVPPPLKLSDRAKRWADLAAKWTEHAGQIALLENSDKPDDQRRKERQKLLTAMHELQKKDTTRLRWFLRWRIQRAVVGHELKQQFATTY